MAQPKLPEGFEYCGRYCPDTDFLALGSKEEEVVPGKPDPNKSKCGGTCRCDAFYSKTEENKGKKESEIEWQFAYPNEKGQVIRAGARGKDHSEDEYLYKFFCVRPVLSKDSEDKYKVCDGGCQKPKPKKTDQGKFYCPPDDSCTGGQCQLFRLKREDRDSKWDYVAKQAEAVELDTKKYYYRCLCTCAA